MDFVACSWSQWDNNPPEGMMVYVDPPYLPKGTQYLNREFNHKRFWMAMKQWAKRNTVVASFYGDIPVPATILHEMNSKMSLGLDHSMDKFQDVSERLYLLSS